MTDNRLREMLAMYLSTMQFSAMAKSVMTCDAQDLIKYKRVIDKNIDKTFRNSDGTNVAYAPEVVREVKDKLNFLFDNK